MLVVGKVVSEFFLLFWLSIPKVFRFLLQWLHVLFSIYFENLFLDREEFDTYGP